MLLVSLAAVLQADAIYSVTDLGAAGGSSTVAFGINSSGIAVGWGETAAGDMNAFSFGSSMQNLAGLAGGTDTYAYGINSSGTTVGISYVNGQAHGEMWNGTTSTDLGAGMVATGINDPGAVIGGNGHAFLLVNGVYRDLGTLPGGNWSTAYGINNAGTVVGTGNLGNGMFRGFIWTAATGMVELGTFGGNNSYANGINSSGEVVGEASLANGYDDAFLAVGAVMTDLGTLGGGNSYAYGINDSGTVVGYSSLADGDSHAFIYINGVMLDLNSLIPSGSGWDLLEAYGINSAGEIVGEGTFDGQSHAFVLNPEHVFSIQQALGGQAVPEPGSGWLIGIGMGLMLVCVWREKLRVK